MSGTSTNTRSGATSNCPTGKILIPGVVSHATNVVEHPELVADRLAAYAGAVGRENVIAGTDCGLGGRVHPQIAEAKAQDARRGRAAGDQAIVAVTFGWWSPLRWHALR